MSSKTIPFLGFCTITTYRDRGSAIDNLDVRQRRLVQLPILGEKFCRDLIRITVNAVVGRHGGMLATFLLGAGGRSSGIYAPLALHLNDVDFHLVACTDRGA